MSMQSPQPKRRRRRTLLTDAESDADAKVTRASRSLDNAAAGVAMINRRRRRALKAKSDTDGESSSSGVRRKPSVARGVVRGAGNSDETVRLTSDDDELPAFNKVNSSFTVGDLIWVKFRHYPFWPALVCCSFFNCLNNSDDEGTETVQVTPLRRTLSSSP